MSIQKKIPFRLVQNAINSDQSVGFCLSCGEEAYGVEPDARNYKCEACGAMEVFGAEEILMMDMADLSDAANAGLEDEE